MNARTFALIVGIVYTAVGILGFFPAFLSPPPPGAPDPAVNAFHGYLLGLFPVNILHNLVHLAVGLLGLAAYRRSISPIRYSQGLAVFYALLAVMGLLPVLNTTFGLIPIHGHDVWLHAGTALAAAYFGWRGATAGGRQNERRNGTERRMRMVPATHERRTMSDRRQGSLGGTAYGTR